MNKAKLIEASHVAFSEPAYRCIDREWIVVGKFCRCGYNGDQTWDVWLCNPKDIRAGLSHRRIRSIANKVRANCRFIELTGEGVYPSITTTELILDRHLLGIRKRRTSDSKSLCQPPQSMRIMP